MNCPKCGNVVNEGASFCAVCGQSLNGTPQVTNQTGKTITVTREKKIMGFAIPFPVFVDGTKIGDLKNGTSLSCEVQPGKHKVVLKCVEKDTEQEVELTDQNNGVEVTCVAKMGLIAARAKITNVTYK